MSQLPTPEVTTSQQPRDSGRDRGTGTSRRRTQRVVSLNPSTYSGECDGIDVILALRSERFDKKTTFQDFLEKMSTYVISNLKDGGDVLTLFTEQTDPTVDFEAKHKPIKPDQSEDDVDEVDIDIYKEDIKQIFTKTDEFKTKFRENFRYHLGPV